MPAEVVSSNSRIRIYFHYPSAHFLEQARLKCHRSDKMKVFIMSYKFAKDNLPGLTWEIGTFRMVCHGILEHLEPEINILQDSKLSVTFSSWAYHFPVSNGRPGKSSLKYTYTCENIKMHKHTLVMPCKISYIYLLTRYKGLCFTYNDIDHVSIWQ